VRVTRPHNQRALSKKNRNEAQLALTLETVWQILESDQWKSQTSLRELCGVDDDTLTNIINFLTRWEFVDVQRSPELLVRRKPGAISPVETFHLLQGFTQGLPSTRDKLAERVACRVCSGRELSFIGVNEVECNRCHERQWYTIEAGESFNEPAAAQQPTRLSFLGRALVRLGFPQRAYVRNSPKPVEYFWFRCTGCGRLSSDYPHGFSRYLNCKFCEYHSHFW
jgi:hypothetical protein